MLEQAVAEALGLAEPEWQAGGCTSSRTVFKGKCVAFCAQVQFPAFASGGKPSVWLKGMMQQFTGSDRFACGGAEFWLAFATIDTKEH